MVIVRHNAFVANLVNTNRIRSFGAKGELYVLFFILYVRVVTYGTAQHDAVHYGKCAFICILYRIFLHHNSLGYILIMKALYIKTSFVISKERNLMGRFLRLALISFFPAVLLYIVLAHRPGFAREFLYFETLRFF